jgi:hypothetical protein
VPSAISRWDLPVPESPIWHNGRPFLTQSQVARVWTTAGSTLALASKSKVRSDFAGEPGRFDQPLGAAPGAVVAFGHQQLGEERAVGHLLAGGGLGQVGELGADGGQAEHPTGLLDGGVCGLLSQPMAGPGIHGRFPSAAWRVWRSSWS